MDRVAITPAMVSTIAGALLLAHGYVAAGHTNTIRAMERCGLVRSNVGGVTLTGRGVWLRGYLMAGGPRRTFTVAEMDDPE
ncbi:hypothetical protein [Streptomyces sp. NPDC000851]